MGKAPAITISLKSLEDRILKASPLFDIIPIRVRMRFSVLTPEEVKDLEEFANVEEGVVERWLLVPDSIPLGSLSYVVDKAFGLLPDPSGNFFSVSDETWNRLFPTMGDFLSACGSILDNPPDVAFSSMMTELAITSPNLLPPLPMALMFPPTATYKESQKVLDEQLAELKKDGILYQGKKCKLEEIPADLDALCDMVKDPENFALSDNLCPDLELRAVLQTEGKKLYGLKEQKKERRKGGLYARSAVKPFAEVLHMFRFDEEDFIAYDFEITRPKDVYELFDEGYLTVEDYLESVQYVLKTMLPDCICKKGYDLFGPDQEFYHEFIMQIHGPESEALLAEAAEAGWKEPYMDLKKVLR